MYSGFLHEVYDKHGCGKDHDGGNDDDKEKGVSKNEDLGKYFMDMTMRENPPLVPAKLRDKVEENR